MKITVFGASGGIGEQVVTLAAQRGHDVRAIYRSTPTDPVDAVEVVVNADILDPAFVRQVVSDVDVVITAVGPNFAKRHNPRSQLLSPPDLHERLARVVVEAMAGNGSRQRLLSVSTGSMGPADGVMGVGPRLLFRFFRGVMVRNLGVVGKDLQAMVAGGWAWMALDPTWGAGGDHSLGRGSMMIIESG